MSCPTCDRSGWLHACAFRLVTAWGIHRSFGKRLILFNTETGLARDKFCTRFCTSPCEKSEICLICEIAGQRAFKNLRLISYLQNGSAVRVLPEEPFFSIGYATLQSARNQLAGPFSTKPTTLR